MGRNVVKSIVGWIIIIGHLSVAIMILIFKDNVFSGDQKLSILLIISPVFSIYFVAVVRSFLSTAYETGPGRKVNANFATICILLPLVQISFVHYIILTYPDVIAGDVDSLQRWLAGLEIFLGGSLGLIADDLFPKAADA